MPNLIDPEYVLALMLKVQPDNVPWRNTYEATAAAVAAKANEMPLYPKDPNGPALTAAIAVAVMHYESHLDPAAKGDCVEKLSNGMCKPGGRPRSFCAFQIHETNFKSLGVTKDELLSNIETCVDAGFRMMHISFGICRGKDWTIYDRLNQYATGGGACVMPTRHEGETRMRKGFALFKAVPRTNPD